LPEIFPAISGFFFIRIQMKTIQLIDTTRKILDNTENLIDELQRLRTITGTETRFKELLVKITQSIAGDLIIIQDLVINGNEVNDFDLIDLIGEYIEQIN
jgi:hypothetical protein